MGDDPPGTSEDLEPHPLNPGTVRRQGGYWNEDSLPVMDWESPGHRVVVPEHLQQHLESTGPVLRWSDVKRRMTVAKRPNDADVANNLSRYLDLWQYVGVEREPVQATRPNNPAKRFRELLQDQSGRWYAISIGIDTNGSSNVITLIGSGNRLFPANRLRGMEAIVVRGK
jgi:hypothetical protein